MAKFIDLVLRGKDLFSSKSDKAAESIGALKTEISTLNRELKSVEKNQATIEAFNELKIRANSLGDAIEETQRSVSQYAKKQAQASESADKATHSYKALENSSKELAQTNKAQAKLLGEYTNKLEKATASHKEQALAVKQAEAAIKQTNESYSAQKTRLSELEAQYKKSKAPVNELTNSLTVAKAELKAIEQVQKAQVVALVNANSKYQQAADEVTRFSQAQKTLSSSLSDAAAKVSTINGQLSELKAKQGAASVEFLDASRNYTAAAKALNKLGTDLNSVNSQLGKAEARLKGANVDIDNLAQSTEKLNIKQSQLVAGTQKAFGSLAKFTSSLKGVRGAVERVKQGIGGFAGSLTSLAGTYFGIRGVTNSLWEMVKVGARFETFRKQFEGIMGSVAQGEQAFQWVKDFARETPLDMAQTTQAFIMLKGAGLDPMDGTLRALTDSTAKYTGGTAKLENITRQLSQAWGKGRINAEDMRIAVDNGLPAWVLLEQATGKNVSELRKLSEQGRLGRYELRLLFQEMGNDALGKSAELMKTFNGQLAVLSFNIQDFLDNVAQSGALNVFTEKLTNLNKEIGVMAEDGRLKKYAQELSEHVIDKFNAVVSLFRTLFKDVEGAIKTTKFFANVIAVAVNSVLAGSKLLISSFSALFKVWFYVQSQVTSLFGLFENTVSKSQESIAKFFEELEKESTKQALVDIKALHAAFDRLGDGTKEPKNNIKGFNKEVADLQPTIEPLAGILEASAEEALHLAINMNKAGDKLKDTNIPIDKVKLSIELLLAKLKEDPSPNVQAVVGRLTALYDSLGDSADKSSGKVVKTLADVRKSFEGIGGNLLSKLKSELKEAAETFDVFKDAKEPVDQLRQAFLQQLDAQLRLSKANTETFLPSTLELTASQLGLTEEFRNAANELDRYNDKISGVTEINEFLAKQQERLQASQRSGTDSTEKQKLAQERLNIANQKAAEQAGINAAFQNLWNQAHERSIRLYDLAALSLDKLRERAGALGESLRDSFRTQSWSNILKPINDLNNAAERSERKAIEQEKAFRELFNELERGSLSTQQLNFYSREASGLFDKLADTRLTALHNQIDIARQAALGLKEDLSNTLNSLQDELDQLEGNQQAIVKRNYDVKKAELEEKLKQANLVKDTKAIEDARTALAIQKKIYDLKTANAKSDSVPTQKTIKEINTNTNNVNTSIKQSVQVQEIRYTVTLKAGSAASTFTGGGSETERFLKQLQEQGFTVTRG